MNAISDKSRIYKNVRIVDSVVPDYAVIGDDSDLVDVVMAPHAEFGRRNIIRSTEIGYGSYTGQNTTIRQAAIGSYCCISSDVNVYGGVSHDYRHLSMYTDYWFKRTFGAETYQPESHLKTVIGSDAWVGSNAVILGGLDIGCGAVIGAGSVVTKNVPPYSVVAGNPAKVINSRFPEEIIKALLEIKWWEFPPAVLAENVDLLSRDVDMGTVNRLYEIKNSLGRRNSTE